MKRLKGNVCSVTIIDRPVLGLSEACWLYSWLSRFSISVEGTHCFPSLIFGKKLILKSRIDCIMINV